MSEMLDRATEAFERVCESAFASQKHPRDEDGKFRAVAGGRARSREYHGRRSRDSGGAARDRGAWLRGGANYNRRRAPTKGPRGTEWRDMRNFSQAGRKSGTRAGTRRAQSQVLRRDALARRAGFEGAGPTTRGQMLAAQARGDRHW